MRRIAALALVLAALCVPGPAPAAESAEDIEKELDAILAEIDGMRQELDRIEETARVPRATGLRVEIRGRGGVQAPVAVRLLLQGRVEEERALGRAERDAFAAGSAPLVVQFPVLPGRYAGRLELLHPSWRAVPAAEFPVALDKGQTAARTFTLSPAPDRPEPVLSSSAESR